MTTALMLRATVHEIAANRDKALALYSQAQDLIAEAEKAARAAAPSGVYELPILHFPNGRSWDRGDLISRTQKTIDKAVWAHVMEAQGITTLMDKSERKKAREELEKDPPPFNADDCRAVIERLIEDRQTIFQRGIANAFAALDRRFKSHDGFKIGSRIVLNYAFNLYGSWNSNHHDESLIDVERVFCLLDGKPQPDRRAGIVSKIDVARHAKGYGPGAFLVEDDYFKVRVYLNGNVHVWFKRDDLVEKVNLNLADYYGAALGAGHEAARHRRSHDPGRKVSRGFDFFPSPKAVAEAVMSAANIAPASEGYTPPVLRVLEPNAGTGSLARPAAHAGHAVTCVEVQPHFADQLASEGLYAEVVDADFLELSTARLGYFDRIVMNPPFGGRADVDHVMHALDFLSPGGVLVAVMAAGAEYRTDRLTVQLRDRVEQMGGRFSDLPPLSFAEVGTRVNTVLLTVRASR